MLRRATFGCHLMTGHNIIRSSILTAALVVFTGATPSFADSFRITITEWCPYMCTETDKRGFTTDIVEAAFRSQGHVVEFLPLPWLRALDLTRKGVTDGSLAPAKAEAPDFIYHLPGHARQPPADVLFHRCGPFLVL